MNDRDCARMCWRTVPFIPGTTEVQVRDPTAIIEHRADKRGVIREGINRTLQGALR
jgi:hypothetical protein